MTVAVTQFIVQSIIEVRTPTLFCYLELTPLMMFRTIRLLGMGFVPTPSWTGDASNTVPPPPHTSRPLRRFFAV
ncbi:hypothetical protein HanIR_Chr06g0293921 [Helianthus annuus]|nr:hypothetical protein HanIR_Chr06g0293921 [Helianthus annuus]